MVKFLEAVTKGIVRDLKCSGGSGPIEPYIHKQNICSNSD